ncbi:MAG: GNAT family N-acetyltransferase [Gammaproteobacteria bacterium]|nr:GNAT family N-acetyltransferase [Gammaproteobacteria bacterium]
MNNQKSATKYYFYLTDWNTSKTRLKTIREQVFIREQGVPVELEWDDLDKSARHVLAEVKLDDEKLAIGTARIIINNDQAHLGRMAVLSAWRGHGIGTKILQTCIDDCLKLGIRQIILNAQVYVIPFYQKSGFEISSKQFMDAGIAHKEMTLSL